MIEIKQISEKEIESLSIKEWPIWEKEISCFDWSYDETEQCLILEGEVIVKIEQNEYHITQGDFVTFRKGLECFWDIKKSIRKHYRFTR